MKTWTQKIIAEIAYDSGIIGRNYTEEDVVDEINLSLIDEELLENVILQMTINEFEAFVRGEQETIEAIMDKYPPLRKLHSAIVDKWF